MSRRKKIFITIIVVIILIAIANSSKKPQPSPNTQPPPAVPGATTPTPTPSTPMPATPPAIVPPSTTPSVVPQAPVSVNVHVGAPTGRTIPDTFYGAQLRWNLSPSGFSTDNVSTTDQYVSTVNTWTTSLPKVASLNPGVLRYPGGLEANEYRWTDAIGPFDKRPTIVWSSRNRGIKVVLGVDEFLRYAERIGAQTMLSANVQDIAVPKISHVGSAQEAAAWVAYVNGREGDNTAIGKDGNGKDWGTVGSWAQARRANCEWLNNLHTNLGTRDCAKPYGVKYWELGNEVSYAVVWPLPPVSMTPGRYGDIVAKFSALMKSIDASIAIGAVGNNNHFNYGAWSGWFSGVANQASKAPSCGNLSCVDFWVKHEYSGANGAVINGIRVTNANTDLVWSEQIPSLGAYTWDFPIAYKGVGTNLNWSLLADGKEVDRGSIAGGLVSASQVTITTKQISLDAGTHVFTLHIANASSDRTLEVAYAATRKGPDGAEQINLKQSAIFGDALFAALADDATYLPKPQDALHSKPVWITEFNVEHNFHNNADGLHEDTGLREGVALAAFFAHYATSTVVRGAIPWELFNGPFGAFGNSMTSSMYARPQALAQELVSRATGQLLRFDARGAPTLTGPRGSTSAVIGYATHRADGRTYIVLINQSSTTNFGTSVSVAGEVVSARGVFGNPVASNESKVCPKHTCVAIQSIPVSKSGNDIMLTLPATSVVVIEVR